MAILSIPIQDALVPRARAAIGRELGLVTVTVDGNGVETRTPRSATVAECEAFAKRLLVEAIRNREAYIAQQAATAAVTEVD
jgi:hypothetical protein